MKRKNFSLVWGRKLFFGVAWPILLLIALSFIFKGGVPESVLSIVLLVLQMISQTGMLILISYFFFFYPVVWLIPTYYFSRIWGIGILNVVIGAYLIDAYSYLTYGIHLNPFVVKHFLNQAELMGQKVYLGIIPLLVISSILWSRGNGIWHLMQKKFMNTNKSWYITAILVSFVGTIGISFYNQAHQSQNIANVFEQFPIKLPLPEVQIFSSEGVKSHLPEDQLINIPKLKNFYPKALACKGEKNFIFVIYKSFPEKELEFQGLGLTLANNYMLKTSSGNALHALMYSFPVDKSFPYQGESQIVRVFQDYEYQMNLFSTTTDVKITGVDYKGEIPVIKDWVKSYIDSGANYKFANFLYIDNDKAYGKSIKTVVDELSARSLMEDTIVVVASLEGTDGSEDLVKSPVYILWKNYEMTSITKMTTHYDLMPTLIQEALNCKGDIKDYSFGKNFLNKDLNNQYYVFNKENKPWIWIADKNLKFSLKDLDYYSKDINADEILNLRKFYYSFLK